MFVEERQSQEATRRVHQSAEQGAPAAGSLECGGERNLYCPIVPLFPRTHHTPGHPVHLQVSSANQPCIPLYGCILSSAATLTDRQHFSVHAEGARLIPTHTCTEGKSSRQIWEDRDTGFPPLRQEGNTDAAERRSTSQTPG